MWGRVCCRLAMVAVLSAGTGCATTIEGRPGDSFTIGIEQPRSLVPGKVSRGAGGRVVDALFTGLVRYGNDHSQPLLAVAASITSDDQQHWTIEIEKGWTFHNGELVTSENFVRAWKADAYGPQLSGLEISGLRVMDDYTFTVELSEPYSQFPMMLGQPGFYPLPKVAFESPEKFSESPVGNGPYEMVEPWSGGRTIRLAAYEDYAKEYEEYGGQFPAQVEGLTFLTFPSPDAAYQALGRGDVDVVPSVPARLADAAQRDFGSRFVFRPGSVLVGLGLPVRDGQFDDVRLRRALSLAIDRERLAEEFFAGTPTAAASLIPTAVPGGREAACAWCRYDPERARELFRAAGGLDGPLHLWVPEGTGHAEVMRAVGSMLRENLGIEGVTLHQQQPGSYQPWRAGQGDRPAAGPWLFSLSSRYPSPQRYVQPLAASDGSRNHTGYASERVDDLLETGAGALSLDAGIRYYQRAEDMVLSALPVIPLWFEGANAAHTRAVDDVIVDAYGHVWVSRVRQG